MNSTPRTNFVLIVCLYLCELFVVLVVLALYRLSSKPDVWSFLSSPSGLLCLAASLGVMALTLIIIRECRKSFLARSREALLILTMNFVSVLIFVGIGELVTRAFSVHDTKGIVIGNAGLLPLNWEDVVAHQSEILQKMSGSPPYLVYDELLGWTVSPNRSSEDGRYFSSLEGVRSPRLGMAFADFSSNYRIALVGDSFTFCVKVSFEESWGHQLELKLGDKFQVLNFGVPGYGVDQAYLRYKRDVRPWKPDIVVMAFISDDLIRTLNVYSFLSGTIGPFAKPRFISKDKQLVALNVPTPRPDEIFSKKSIHDLPFIDYDRYYHWTEWERPNWRYLQLSYLFRLMTTLYPVREAPREETSDVVMEAVSSEIVRSFIQLARADGSIPIVVFFPLRDDLENYLLHPSIMPRPVKLLRDAGIEEVTDLTPCLSGINTLDLFLERGPRSSHYSAKGYAAVANCLHSVLRTHFSQKNQEQNRRFRTLS